jgi:hypothetical protein
MMVLDRRPGLNIFAAPLHAAGTVHFQQSLLTERRYRLGLAFFQHVPEQRHFLLLARAIQAVAEAADLKACAILWNCVY